MGYGDKLPVAAEDVWLSQMNVERIDRCVGASVDPGITPSASQEPVYGMRAVSSHRIQQGDIAVAAEKVDAVFSEHVRDAVHEIDRDTTL